MGSPHVKLPTSFSHEWLKYCHNGSVELENKVLNKWGDFCQGNLGLSFIFKNE